MYKINMKGFINKCLLFWTRFLLSQELTQKTAIKKPE